MKNLSRRDLFSGIFSKDTVKVFSDISNEIDHKAKIHSCEEVGILLGRKSKKNLEIYGTNENLTKKEG